MYLKIALQPDHRKDRSPEYKLVFDILFLSCRGLLCTCSSGRSVLLVSSTHNIISNLFWGPAVLLPK